MSKEQVLDRRHDADGDGVTDTADCAPDDPQLPLDWPVDEDGDGHASIYLVRACDAPTSAAAPSTPVDDCDDDDADISPEAQEVCDGLDDNCDGLADDDAPDLDGAPTWYFDRDGDGFGSDTDPVSACERPADDAVSRGGDCDDTDPSICPYNLEICDDLDDDCDGAVDEDAMDAEDWYEDDDDDGYGARLLGASCAAPEEGAVELGGDCDDSEANVKPGMVEVCDGQDNDCDGLGSRCLAGTVELDDLVASTVTCDEGDLCATALALADPDGDGTPTLLIGAPGSPCSEAGEEACGAVLSVEMSALADDEPSTHPTSTSLSGSTLLEGPTSYAAAGSALAAGDLDGDGFVDLLVGIPEALDPDGRQTGGALLIYGPSLDADDGDWLSGAGDPGRAGLHVGWLATEDGALPLIGAPDQKSGASGYRAGGAWLLTDTGSLTASTALEDVGIFLDGEAAYDLSGLASAGATDLNGDGVADLVVAGASCDGSPTTPGAGSLHAWLDRPEASQSLGSADLIWRGVSGERLGASLTDGGDLNGDGYADLIAGAPGAENADELEVGAVAVVFGGTEDLLESAPLTRIDGSTDGGLLGASASSGVDLDDDGFIDVIVSSPSAGEIWAIYGPISAGGDILDLATTRLDGDVGDTLGASLAMDDTSAEGATLLLIGAPNNDNGGTDAGSVFNVRLERY